MASLCAQNRAPTCLRPLSCPLLCYQESRAPGLLPSCVSSRIHLEAWGAAQPGVWTGLSEEGTYKLSPEGAKGASEGGSRAFVLGIENVL